MFFGHEVQACDIRKNSFYTLRRCIIRRQASSKPKGSKGWVKCQNRKLRMMFGLNMDEMPQSYA